MSSSANQMESGDSTDSLLSRGHSEMGSQFVMESGVYMSSFAATIFIAALVTIGVLVLTLLVALTVMLDSCQSRSAGILEHVKTSDDQYDCALFAFHAELNNLKADELPTICKQHSLTYITGGRFLRDLNLTLGAAERYFSTRTPNDDGLDIILMDADDLFLSDVTSRSSPAQYWIKEVEDMKHLAHRLVLSLHMKLQASGWSLVLFTRNPMRVRKAIRERLISAGYGGWSLLIMRSDDELAMESWEYISSRRRKLCGEGFRIASVISSCMDALTGPCLGKQNFKLANPLYYMLEQQ